MKHFLIVFDRSDSRALSITDFDDRAVALRERFVAERLHRASPDVEVVVLTAESRESLQNTHSRYFGVAMQRLNTAVQNNKMTAYGRTPTPRS